MKPISIHTVPSAVYDRLSQGVIVSRLQPNGRFADTYVSDLVQGDQFYVDQSELPPRCADNILKWVGDKKITWVWERGFLESDDQEPNVVEIQKDELIVLHRHRYWDNDHSSALRDAIEYVMDQEEL